MPNELGRVGKNNDVTSGEFSFADLCTWWFPEVLCLPCETGADRSWLGPADAGGAGAWVFAGRGHSG